MCTAVSYCNGDHYFGRNLDLEYSYHETVTITPRNHPFVFRKAGRLDKHYAMIGMAYVVGKDPLYYEATNEKGLSMAGLNFPGNADYKQETLGKDNVAPFEFIPWILGQCASVDEAKQLLDRINLVNINYSSELPLSPLHWLISDRNTSLTVESVRDGLKIHENPVGVLTNNPPFEYQMFQLNNYMHVSPEHPENRFCDSLPLSRYSLGMGSIGLPGGMSSTERFVKATFTKLNSVSGQTESENISQLFHILGSVEQQRGCTLVRENEYEITLYSSCCNTDRGIYYYRTYENSQITAVNMHHENLDSEEVVCYPLVLGQQIRMQN